MTSLSRAFVAVYPPEDVLDALEERLRRVSGVDGLRWMPRDQWHVTLRFCGRVADADALVDALRASLAEVPAVADLELRGAGAFPKARHGSVLWVGITPGDAARALGRVAAATEAACVAADLAPDDRAFRPHLTVARRPRAGDLRPLVAGFGDEAVGPPWSAGAVSLMESETRPTGSVHTPVARLALSG